MKHTIHSITWDLHHGSVETDLFTTEAARDEALKRFLEQELEGDDAPAITEVRALIKKGEIRQAWDDFTEYEKMLKHPEDYIYLNEHTIELPESEVLAALKEVTFCYANARAMLHELNGSASDTPVLMRCRAAIQNAGN